jgi:hypothetical protein
MFADRLAQEPDSVADVPCFIVVDEAVVLDEPGEEFVLVEVVGDERERGQSERGLDDLVVERDEADFGAEVAGSCEKLLVCLDEGDVEDLAEFV